MQGGDISNEVAPRIIFIFEDTIGAIAAPDQRRHDRYVRRGRYRRAARMWELSKHAVRVLHDLERRSPYNVDIATYLDPDEAEHIEDRLESIALPFGHFLVTNTEEMARVIVNQPQVAAVFDGNRARQFAYGGKGRVEMVL